MKSNQTCHSSTLRILTPQILSSMYRNPQEYVWLRGNKALWFLMSSVSSPHEYDYENLIIFRDRQRETFFCISDSKKIQNDFWGLSPLFFILSPPRAGCSYLTFCPDFITHKKYPKKKKKRSKHGVEYHQPIVLPQKFLQGTTRLD